MLVRASALICSILVAALPASAEDAASSPYFVIVLPTEAEADVELAVRAHLIDVEAQLVVERLDLSVQFREHLVRAGELASSNGAIGVIWVDFDPTNGDILLYLFDRQGTRTMVRRLEADEDTAAARLEGMALATRSMVTAVVEGGTIDVRPPAPPAPVEEPIEEPIEVEPVPRIERDDDEEPGPPFIEVTVGYAGQLIHERVSWQNGVRTSAAWLSPSGRFSVGLAYVFWLPTDFGFQHAQLRFSRHSWELWGSFSVPLRVLRVGGEFALFGELSRRETSTSNTLQGFQATEPENNLVVGLALRIRLHVQIWRWLGLEALVGVDGLLRRVRYTIETPSNVVILDPLLIRPMVVISLCGQFG